MLFKILQNAHDNTCTRNSFSINLQASVRQLYKKRDSGTNVFLWICVKFLRTSFLTEHLRWLLLRINFSKFGQPTPPPFPEANFFFHVNLGHIKFLQVNNVWGYSLFIEQDSSDVKNVALSEFVVFFSMLNIYTLNIKYTVTKYISNWYTQE